MDRSYGTGDHDRHDPGGKVLVKFKQFADDFDNIQLRPHVGPSIEAMGDLMPMMVKLRQVATKQKLDLTDAFEEAAGKSRDAQLGLMAKNRFATALGLMFKGEVTQQAIAAICSAYGAGDPDPREPGTFVQVHSRRVRQPVYNTAVSLHSCHPQLPFTATHMRACSCRCSSRSLRSTSTTSSYLRRCPRARAWG